MHELPHASEPPMEDMGPASSAWDAPGPAATVDSELAAVAIIGTAGRFPGAADIDAFWRKLCAGEECLTRFSAAELREAGVPRALLDDRNYVPVNGMLADIERFDAAFFEMNPREASIT